MSHHGQPEPDQLLRVSGKWGASASRKTQSMASRERRALRVLLLLGRRWSTKLCNIPENMEGVGQRAGDAEAEVEWVVWFILDGGRRREFGLEIQIEFSNSRHVIVISKHSTNRPTMASLPSSIS